MSSATFIGRRDELDQLLRAYERAQAGSAGVVLVVGEAGIGKTRLVRELVARVQQGPGRALVGGSVPFLASLPYAPFIEALRPVVTNADAASLTRTLGPSAGLLARLFPELDSDERSSPPAAPDPTAQSRLFEHVLGVVGLLARQAPTVIALEDLHWADASTRDLFAFLARNLTAERIMLLATYRDDELPVGHPLRVGLARLELDRPIERIELRRFERPEFDLQLLGIGRPELPAALASRVFERSGGNPFLTEELVRDEATLTRGEVPPSVRDALSARVQRLSAAAQQVLRSAAVVGGDFDLALLVFVAGLPAEAVESGLREAAHEHIVLVRGVADDRRYVFRHALWREMLYDDLLATERARLHGRVAEALAAGVGTSPGGGTPLSAQLAVHWARAGRPREALAASLRAADDAAASYAFPEELSHLEQVLLVSGQLGEHGLSPSDEADVAERAARAAERVGELTRQVELIERALSTIDREANAQRAASLNARLADRLFSLNEVARAERALEDALALLPDRSPTAALVELLHAAMRATGTNIWRPTGKLLEELAVERSTLLSIARQTAEPRVEAEALLAVGHAEYGSDVDDVVAGLRQARRIGEELNDPEVITGSIHQLGHVLDGSARFEEAQAVFLEGAARARELGLERSIGRAMETDAAESLRQSGRWAEADALLASVLDELQRFGTYAPPMRHAVPGHLYVGMGRFSDAERQLAAALKAARGGGASGMVGHVFAGRAEMAIWRGDLAEALSQVAEGLARIGSTADLRWIAALAGLGLRAAAEQAQLDRVRGDLRAAGAALESGAQLIESARQTAARWLGWPEGAAHLAQAEADWRELSGQPEAELWNEAAERWSQLAQPYPRAYARFREAQALRRQRAPRSAVREALGDAHATALALGAVPLADAIATFARGERLALPAHAGITGRAAGAASPRADAPFGLTNREREVLTLVVAGRTNREIADALYISESTAGVHVSNILGKLGVQNRAQAAALATRMGLG